MLTPARESAKTTSERSAAWLARLSGGQKVASSNLAVPTIASYARHWLSHWWAFFAHDSAERSETHFAPFVSFADQIPPGAVRLIFRLLCLLWIKFRRAQRDSFCAFCVFGGSNSNLLVFMNVARCLAVELCPDTICQVPAKNSMTVLSPVPPTAIKAVAQGARLNTLAGKSIAIVVGSFMANVTHPELKRLILKEYPNTRCE